MMGKIKMYLIAAGWFAALLVGAGITWSVYAPKLDKARQELSEAQAELRVQRVVIAAREAADRVREASRARVERNHERASDELVKATTANPDWASEPVPADVLAVLRNAAKDANTAP